MPADKAFSLQQTGSPKKTQSILYPVIFSMDWPISIVRSIDEYAIFEIQDESRFGTHHDLQLGYQLAGTVGT